ncbi:hypothetical protein GCM10025867_49760 (plasmid) [Frondihabitans sucicola]|uniref:Uncharacterized protein n=1 Tax=Frondihabitans sucicola TaxID=1268041 RepID=A0ABM8GW78_9MICO|nr:hypothetical protein [Frondihabitans sucicola]BDZ52735.1 hypothetical protein GCM10025867_49760 [Frondihabitans sucicola]
MLTSASIPANAEIARLTPTPRTVETSRHGRNPAATLLPLVGAVSVFALAFLEAPMIAQALTTAATIALFLAQRVTFMLQDRARARMNTWSRLVRSAVTRVDTIDFDEAEVERVLRASIHSNHPDLPGPNFWRAAHSTDVFGDHRTDTLVVAADGSILLLTDASGARSRSC